MLGTNAYKIGFYQNFVWESDVYSNARRVTGDKLVLHAIGLCILVWNNVQSWGIIILFEIIQHSKY